MQSIAIWSDYEWCYEDDIHEYSHKSDDYTIVSIEFDEEPTHEQLKQIVG